MTDDLEFSISQYVDGTLTGDERAELEAILARDDAARAMLDAYRKLDGVIRNQSTPLPEIQWEALHRNIADFVAEESQPPESYKMGRAKIFARGMALAASLLVATGVAIKLIHPVTPAVIPTPVRPSVVAIANVTGPAIETPAGAPADQVTITPPASAAAMMYPDAEGVVYQPSLVTIASAADMRKGFH